MTDDADAQARRARREWIAAHHPDRGGDPAAFTEGLARFAAPDPPDPSDPAAPRPAVHRSRSPLRRVHRLVRQIRRARRGQPPRRLR